MTYILHYPSHLLRVKALKQILCLHLASDLDLKHE